MVKPQPCALFKILFLSAFLFVGSHAAYGQTPVPTPVPNPAQKDATRPPGQETQNPTAAPGTQQQPPTAPPGVQQPNPQAPPGAPVAVPQTQTPSTATPPVTTDVDPIQEPREPVFPAVEQKPLPPMPNMTRLGVTSDNTIPMSLNDAVKRALTNNNDIEFARDEVRFAETQLRALEGIYDPFLSFTPQIDKRISPQQGIFSGSTASGTISSNDLHDGSVYIEIVFHWRRHL